MMEFRSWLPGNPDLTGLEDDETAKNLVGLLLHNMEDSVGQRAASLARKTNEHHACGGSMAHKYVPAEIFVLGKENSPFSVSLLNHSRVERLVGEFRHRVDILAGTMQLKE